jgi:hypothetical protein
MATFATLEDLKEQCNVQHNEDDKRLREMLDAAESWVEKTIQQPLQNVCVNGQLPKPVKQAILIYAAGLYANREPVAFSGQPTAIPYFNPYALLTPYINYR